jgi:hypothetical protein
LKTTAATLKLSSIRRFTRLAGEEPWKWVAHTLNHANNFAKLITNMTYKQLIEKLQTFSPEQLEQTVTVWNVWTDELTPVAAVPKKTNKILLELNN